MFRQLIHIIVSLWLAILLLFGMTPKEFVHLLASHQDTVHSHEHPGPVFEKEHHHCSFLGFQLMPFDNDIRLPQCPRVLSISFLPVYFSVSESDVRQPMRLQSLRGPPTV